MFEVKKDQPYYYIPIGQEFNIDINNAKLINSFINKTRKINNIEQKFLNYLLFENSKIIINMMSFHPINIIQISHSFPLY